MTETSIVTKRHRITSGTLELEFYWTGDRFAHRVRVAGSVAAQSVEGDCEISDPPSPPMQELHFQTVNGFETLFGVGGSGRGRYSVVVTAVDAGFRFEWAVNGHVNVAALGNAYRVDRPLWLDFVDVAGASATLAQRQLNIRVEPSGGATRSWSYLIIPRSPLTGDQ